VARCEYKAKLDAELAEQPRAAQGYDRMEMISATPEEVLRAEKLQSYRELHEDLWDRLIQLHHTIITLEKMEEFPFDLFYPRTEMTFWRTVDWNFLQMAVNLLYGLVDDRTRDAHTLTKFKNKILQWVKPEYKEDYQRVLKQAKLNHKAKHIRDRVKQLRHKIVAHRLLARQTGLPHGDVPGISISELRELYDSIEALFVVCCFGEAYLTTTIDYHPEATIGGQPVPSSIDKLLQLVARHSHFVNEPEEEGSRWPVLRKHKSAAELGVLNEWRRKFGLPDA